MDNPIAEAYVKMLQERKEKAAKDAKLDDGDGMDPVGQGDADIDNDGDVDSSDEYLHKRRKAIKKSIKKEGTESLDEVRQLKDPKKEVMVVDKKGKTMVIDKSKQAAYLAKGWGLAEGIEIDDEEESSEVDDPKAKKKGEKKTGKTDPAAANAPSQDDREAAADSPDPSPDPDAEPSEPKEKPAPAPKKAVKKVAEGTESLDEDVTMSMGWKSTDKSFEQLMKALKPGSNMTKTINLTVKVDNTMKKIEKLLGQAYSHWQDIEQQIGMRNEGFDWDAISEMTDDEVDSYVDSLDESQLEAFESEMNEAANADGDAEQQDKEQLDFIRKHSDKANIVDRPDADKPAAADATSVSKKRPGDNDKGDKKVKRLKDVRS